MFRRKEEHNQQITESKGAQVENIQAVNSNEGESSRPAAPHQPSLHQSLAQPAAPQPLHPSVPQSAAQPELRPSPKPTAVASRFERRIPKPLGAFEPSRPSEESKSQAPAFRADADHGSPKRILTVGEDTVLKGEISTCDRLVVEGTVDAILTDVHTVEVASTGAFRGSATVENAEISGRFEGDLDVSGRLVIYATGCVTGRVTYNEIEIERGGRLSGKIALSGDAAEDAGLSEMKKAVFS